MKECFVYNDAKCCCKDGVCLDSESGCKSFVSHENLYEFNSKVLELTDKYKISEEHAGCYLCNFDDEYICKTYNNGCKTYNECKNMNDEQ